MAQGNWTGTASSAQIVAANYYRDCLVIQKTNATAVALGIGVAAEAGKGIQLVNINDTIVLKGTSAREAVYAIGNGGTGTYAEIFGDAAFTAGPYVSA